MLMPYTERSRANLIREGIKSDRIYVTGNPIFEVIEHYAPEIEISKILTQLGIESKKYFLVTMHRQENVDIPDRLSALIQSLEQIHKYLLESDKWQFIN